MRIPHRMHIDRITSVRVLVAAFINIGAVPPFARHRSACVPPCSFHTMVASPSFGALACLLSLLLAVPSALAVPQNQPPAPSATAKSGTISATNLPLPNGGTANGTISVGGKNTTTPANSTSPAPITALPTFSLTPDTPDAKRARTCTADSTFCVTLIDHGTSVTFAIDAPGEAKWLACGLGTKMDGADIVAGYMYEGKFVVSDRKGVPDHKPPLVDAKQDALAVKGGMDASSGRWVSVYQRMKATGDKDGDLEVDTSKPVSLIVAYGAGDAAIDVAANKALDHSEFRAKFTKHKAYGKLVVDLNDPKQVAAAAAASASATSAAMPTPTAGAGAATGDAAAKGSGAVSVWRTDAAQAVVMAVVGVVGAMALVL
ncbi:hypothetical protein AMAG_15628 [Allomyces macrogynus ATCC 38327]|uniref:DOMON domain-containing protein n=1 Tax=Allomyces macrogynus (strain ATCC 38327) TaxID=578462 RepID=A0A0L0T9J7_ALLM3|nr:hypothetical protein AMAG_15628 [Allomyces macrogynus ATCC 38327]|eukprot:KNE71390.1 hypothetical protein AMAG_15628 [Allomyces macrogynus ATCC 38327]